MFAAGGGHNETTKLLIDARADVDIIVQATPEYVEQNKLALAEGKEDVERHKNGVTALSIAAQGGHYGTAKLVLDAGAAVNTVDEEGLTPLLNAVKGGFTEVATLLLQHGANPNDVYTDDKNVTHNLLMDAILYNKTAYVQLLVEKGADLTYTDADGVSLLTQASYLGLSNIVDILLAHSVDVSASNKEGINPLIAASSEGHVKIAKRILEHKGADPNSKDKDGTSALMAAAVRGHKEVVEELLKSGADVNAQNVDGHTALMFAFNGKNQVETLLDKYSEYIKDEGDASTTLIAEALQSHKEVIALLLKGGADANLKVSIFR